MSIEHGAAMYDFAQWLFRATPGELAEVDARHRAAGYGRAPARAATVGTISACEPTRPPTGEWVRCECGSVMLAQHLVEHMARAAAPAEARVWSLHNELLARRGA